MHWQFDWDKYKAADNLRLHGVSFEEAREAFTDPNAKDEFDRDHSDEELRYKLIGLSSRRLLMVVYKEELGMTIRLISARKADHTEQDRYEKTKDCSDKRYGY